MSNSNPKEQEKMTNNEGFYQRLDRKEQEGRIARIFKDRPDNLHDYQGCANDEERKAQSMTDGQRVKLCMEISKPWLGWHCSLQKGHQGNHRAYRNHDITTKMLEEWPNQSDAASRLPETEVAAPESAAYPVLKDAIYAMIAEVAPPPLVVSETAVAQLWPLLEELRQRRSGSPAMMSKREKFTEMANAAPPPIPQFSQEGSDADSRKNMGTICEQVFWVADERFTCGQLKRHKGRHKSLSGTCSMEEPAPQTFEEWWAKGIIADDDYNSYRNSCQVAWNAAKASSPASAEEVEAPHDCMTVILAQYMKDPIWTAKFKKELSKSSSPAVDGGESEYQRGFNDCREQAMRIVDESDGYLSKVEALEPLIKDVRGK